MSEKEPEKMTRTEKETWAKKNTRATKETRAQKETAAGDLKRKLQTEEGETTGDGENAMEVETPKEVGTSKEEKTPEEVETSKEVEPSMEMETLEEGETANELETATEVETLKEVETSNEVETPKEVEPPKKRRRKHPQASSAHAPTEAESPQQDHQLPAPSTFDMEEIRRTRRENALRILDEVLPAMVVRLRDLHRRSKTAADERRGGDYSATDHPGSTLVDGPWTSAKKRSLTRQLERLVSAAKGLLQQHNELLREGNERKFERKKMSNAKLLQKLTSEAENLTKTHLMIHEANRPDEEDSQREYLEEARLILNHPIFGLLQPEVDEEEEEEEGQRDDDAPTDALAPLSDTTELIELVTAELRKMVECSNDLKQWVLLSAPPLDVEADYENQVRRTVHVIVDTLVATSKANLNYIDEYLIEKTEFEVLAIREPLSMDRMRALDAFQTVKAIHWRAYANFLALDCELLMDTVQKHINILEQRRPNVSAVAHLLV